MKRRIGWGFALAAAVGMFIQAAPALATPISQTISLGTVFTGAAPSGSGPWLTATFTGDTGSKTGMLVLTADLMDANFIKGQNTNSGWAFYLGTSLLSLSCKSGTCASSVTNGSFGTTGPVKGGFNLGFVWPANTFTGTVSATYSLTFASDLSGNPFVANSNGWLSDAHVQGITKTATCSGTSGWIVAGTPGPGVKVPGPDAGCAPPPPPPPVTVPEPSSLAILGLGTLLLGVFIGLRRRFS